MGRCWMFEEIDEYSPLALKIISHDFKTIQSVEKEKLKLTEFSSNPLVPILRTWQVWGKNWLTAATKDVSLTDTEVLLRHALLDIQELVRRTEKKEA